MTLCILISEAKEMERDLHENSFFLLRDKDDAEFFVNPQSRTVRLP